VDEARARRDGTAPPPPDACYWCHGTRRAREHFYDDRDYNVFSILADVRNGGAFVPIADPRGLPEDMSPQLEGASVDQEEDGPDLGEHSQTWLTLDEVLGYDWDQTAEVGGLVDPWNFELWRRNGVPESWCGGVGGGGVEHVSNERMAEIIDSGELKWGGPEPAEPTHFLSSRPYTTSPIKSYYTEVKWRVRYGDEAKHFLEMVERDLVPLGKPEDVRLIFGFDS
jgi:hypothetical protein